MTSSPPPCRPAVAPTALSRLLYRAGFSNPEFDIVDTGPGPPIVFIDSAVFARRSLRLDDLRLSCRAYGIPCRPLPRTALRRPEVFIAETETAKPNSPLPSSRSADFAAACRSLASALPGITNVTSSEDADSIGAWMDLGRADFFALDCSLRGRDLTLICVPSRVWHRPDIMEEIQGLKMLLEMIDKKVILVPERWIRREPRLSNAHMIAGSRHATLSHSDRMRVLTTLIEEDTVSLIELAGLMNSADPVSSVLRLVCEGCLELNLDKPILPTTLVRMAQPVSA